MDITDAIAQQLETTIKGGKTAAGQVTANDAKAQNTLNGIQKIYETMATDAATVKNAETAAKLNTQVATDALVTAMGADPKSSANVLLELAREQATAQASARDNFKELHRRSEIKPTQDFSGFLSAQLFGVEESRAAYRKAAGYSDLLTKQVSDANQLIQQSVAIYKAVEAPITQGSAEAAARIAASQAAVAAQQSALDGIKHSTEAVIRAQALDSQQLGLLFQARSAQQSEEAHKLALKNFDLHVEQFNWQKEEKRIADEARADGKQLDEHILENINIGRSVIGQPAIDAREGKFILQQFKAGKTDLYEAYLRGGASKDTGIAMIGTSPADTIRTFDEHPDAVARLPESKQPTIRLLAQARENVRGKIALEKDPLKISKIINDEVASIVQQQYSNVTRSEDNVFNIGDLKQFLGSPTGDQLAIPAPTAIAASSVYKKFLVPLRDANIDLSDQRVVMQMVVKAIKDKQITFEDAVDMSTVYKQATVINLQARGLTGMGIIPPNVGRTLNVRVNSYGKAIDLTDPVAISNYLSGELSPGGKRSTIINTPALGGAGSYRAPGAN